MMTMKITVFLLASMGASVVAFAPSSVSSLIRHYHTTTSSSSLSMFGGAGDVGTMDDDPAMDAQMEMAAKQLGIPLDEYKLGIQARMRLTKQLDEARITAGDETKIAIERDANNPPKYIEIVVTDDGKALGKDIVTKEVLAQLQSTAEYAKTKRGSAQRDMMMWIGDEMKKRGKA